MHGMINNQLTTNQVRATVERAGKTMSVFRVGFLGAGPQGHRSGWPDVMKEMIIIVQEDGKGLEIIMPEPEVLRAKASMREITEMEMVFDWIRDYAMYCKQKNISVRFVNTIWLGMRHSQWTGKRIYGWRKLAREFSKDGNRVTDTTVKRWYDEGIERITVLRNEKIHRGEKIVC